MALEIVHISRPVHAWQFTDPDSAIRPDDVHITFPEVRWNVDQTLIYFSYGTLHPHAWMGVRKLATEPGSNGGLSSWVKYRATEGQPSYYREIFPFAFWKVKSKASVLQDHRAVFLDPDDEAMLGLWHDYCAAEQWPNPLPRFAEYRISGRQYGRGYKPVYASVGDWLVWEDGREVAVMSDDEFTRIRLLIEEAPPLEGPDAPENHSV